MKTLAITILISASTAFEITESNITDSSQIGAPDSSRDLIVDVHPEDLLSVDKLVDNAKF